MLNLDRLELLDEKLKLLDGLTLSVVRSFALAVFVVACAKSSLTIEMKAVVIAGIVFAYTMLMALAEAVASLGSSQRETTHFTQLSAISLETQRLLPSDTRNALEIQRAVENASRDTYEYKIERGSVSDALSQHVFWSFLKLGTIACAIAIVWFAWAPSVGLVTRFN
jgi:hypothetical protein